MKEYVYVEFIIETGEVEQLNQELEKAGAEFDQIISDFEFETDSNGATATWYRIGGKIKAETLTCIKLQNEYLAKRLRISYIDDELKNKYRR